ncbi:MAG: hypothetical protein HDT28_09260 [Clostridiales bacterium]|nr:hypothetical protein [Clostridiales bacterium]
MNMRKIPFIFAAIMTVVTVLFLCSCGVSGMKNVSERRSGYFTATADGCTVTAVSGVREDPYALDGATNELVPYTLITLVPSSFDVDAVYTYVAVVDGSTFGGTLVVHPFAASFSAEFEHEAIGEFTVSIERNGTKTDYALSSLVTADMIDYSSAISAAENEFRDLSGQYEIRARIIKNPIDGSGVCWHVAFITAEGQCGVLLDPVTARVIAKKAN